MLHAWLFPSSLASSKARYLKKISCSSNLGIPGNTMCQKDCEKQPIKKKTFEFVCEKLTFLIILSSSIVKFRSATRYSQKLLIGEKDHVTVVGLAATWWQSFALNRISRYPDFDLPRHGRCFLTQKQCKFEKIAPQAKFLKILLKKPLENCHVVKTFCTMRNFKRYLLGRLRDVRNSDSENLFPTGVKRTKIHQNMQNFIPKSL
jgi:hypothetical protein